MPKYVQDDGSGRSRRRRVEFPPEQVERQNLPPEQVKNPDLPPTKQPSQTTKGKRTMFSGVSGRAVRFYNRILIEMMYDTSQQVLSQKPEEGVSFLDIGGGGVKFSKNLSALRDIGVPIGRVMVLDIDQKKLDNARINGFEPRGFTGDQVTYARADFTDKKFSLDFQADVVNCVDVLEHLPSRSIPLAFRRIYDLSRGFAIISSPNEPIFSWTTLATALLKYRYPNRWQYIINLGSDPDHLQFFTPGVLRGLSRDAGFDIQWDATDDHFLRRWVTLQLRRKDWPGCCKQH